MSLLIVALFFEQNKLEVYSLFASLISLGRLLFFTSDFQDLGYRQASWISSAVMDLSRFQRSCFPREVS